MRVQCRESLRQNVSLHQLFVVVVKLADSRLWSADSGRVNPDHKLQYFYSNLPSSKQAHV